MFEKIKPLPKKVMSILLSLLHPPAFRKLHKADLLVVRHDADCSYNYRGQAYSPLIDTVVELAEREGHDVVSVATAYSRFTGVKAFASPVSLNRRFFAVALAGFMLKPFVPAQTILRWKSRCRQRLWENVLEHVCPKLIIGIRPDNYLCAASRGLSIPVYDLQHGSISPDHIWYGQELQNETPIQECPTGMLFWDQESENVLSLWSQRVGLDTLVIGNPWFSRFANQLNDDRLVSDALKNRKLFDNNKPTILVSLQWGLAYLYYSGTEFSLMAEALKQVIRETSRQFNWALRLHPVQMRGEELKSTLAVIGAEFASVKDLNWKEASEIPLPALLSQIDLHITDFSSVVVEASWFDIPSAMLNPFLAEGKKLGTYYQAQRDSGIASLLDQDANVIKTWIEQSMLREKRAGLQSDLTILRDFLQAKLVAANE